MKDIFFMTYYSKEDSGMPFNALEALVRADAPKDVKKAVINALESNGFEFMDESIDVDGKDGKWDYLGKILPDE